MNEKDQLKLTKMVAARYFDNPTGYCSDVLGFRPDQWQVSVLDSVCRHRRTAVRSGHGVGKTRLAAACIHWFIATRAYPQIICTSETAVQLATRLWRELAVVNSTAVNAELFEWQATTFKFKLAADRWFALAQPWTKERPEAFQGAHEQDLLMLFDEASAIPDEIWDAASGSMSTSGARWLVQGNPTRNTGKFYDCFGKNKALPNESDEKGYWHTHTVSCFDSTRPGMAQYIEEQKREYGEDSDFYRIRVLGIPPQQEVKQFISREMFGAAVARPVIENKAAQRILGVDVAWEGDDRTVLVRKHGFKIDLVAVRRGQDTMATVGDIIQELRRAREIEQPYDHVVVDTIGVGAGVFDRLREQGIAVTGVNVGIASRVPDRYRNLRAELWDLYRKWLETGTIAKDFEEDSCGIQYMITSSGVIAMEKKGDLKKRGLPSPDLADAACLCFYIQGDALPFKRAAIAQRPVMRERSWRR